MSREAAMRRRCDSAVAVLLLLQSSLFVHSVGTRIAVGSEASRREALQVPGAPPPSSSSSQIVTFQVSDGDRLSCVPSALQPSAPRSVQAAPVRSPRGGNVTDVSFDAMERANSLFPLEHPGGCPAGTIPYRVSSHSTGADAVSLLGKYHVGKYRKPEASVSRWGLPTSSGDPSNEHLHAYTYLNGNYTGTEVTMSAWAPFVVGDDAFSVSQLWVIGGSQFDDFNTIEAGWQVYPYKYGDTNPRLFIYWTSDGYSSTGCYNLDCPGFVQVSHKVLLGGSIAPVSSLDSIQYEIKLRVFKDNATGNWWLQFNDENVGYWPSSLFTHLRSRADTLNWGAEVYYSDDTVVIPGLKHRMKPFMGSGEFPTAGFQRAAYHRNVQFVDTAGQLRDAQGMLQAAEIPIWYFTYPYVFDDWRASFFYGGPGLTVDDGCGSFGPSPAPAPSPEPFPPSPAPVRAPLSPS